MQRDPHILAQGRQFQGASGGLRQSGGPWLFNSIHRRVRGAGMTSILHGVVEELRSSTGFFSPKENAIQYVIREPSLIQ